MNGFCSRIAIASTIFKSVVLLYEYRIEKVSKCIYRIIEMFRVIWRDVGLDLAGLVAMLLSSIVLQDSWSCIQDK